MVNVGFVFEMTFSSLMVLKKRFGEGGGGLFVNAKISQVKILRNLVTSGANFTETPIGVFWWISLRWLCLSPEIRIKS